MTTTSNQEVDFNKHKDLRERNRQTIQDYMSRVGEGRLTRYLLFTEDGTGGLYTGDKMEPIISSGHSGLKSHGEWSLKCFPDWVWYNVEIFDTQDPNRFWVECDGKGKICFPGYPEGYYTNHFIHSFLFEEGKIKQNREFMNPYQQMRALGIPIPEIKREGIPA